MKNTKRMIAAAMGVALLASTAVSTTVTASMDAAAKPSPHSIYVDGEKANVAAYGINGNNYFKLRDIAAIVNSTPKQFEVTWNGAQQRIDLMSNQPYTVVGGELGAVAAGNKVAKESKAIVYKDGAQAKYTGYMIGGNNYYKLRDVCDDFGIGVNWDAANQRVDLFTKDVPVEPEQPVKPVEPIKPVEPEPVKPIEPEPPEQLDIPAVGEYSDAYQNYLDNCGEEIVTCSIKYYTHEHRRDQDGVEGGFIAAIKAYGPVSYLNGNESPFPDSGMYVQTVYIDKSGYGTVEFKMPKSLHEKTLSGNVYYRLTYPGTETTEVITDSGRRYSVGGSNIQAMHLRSNRPAKLMVTFSDLDYRP